MSKRDCLIVFSRYPEPGKTKTRLIPALGPDGAADLHREMTLHTLQWAEHLVETRSIELQIRFTGADEAEMTECFGSQFNYVPQGDGDLGQRLERAFEESFRSGNSFVIAVGTDCPGLSTDIVLQAFAQLRDHDLVVGPAADGGYYLIGLASHVKTVFAGIAWGTDQVLAQTLIAATQAKLSVSVLQTLADVDRPEDLENWKRSSRYIPKFLRSYETGGTLSYDGD